MCNTYRLYLDNLTQSRAELTAGVTEPPPELVIFPNGTAHLQLICLREQAQLSVELLINCLHIASAASLVRSRACWSETVTRSRHHGKCVAIWSLFGERRHGVYQWWL